MHDNDAFDNPDCRTLRNSLFVTPPLPPGSALLAPLTPEEAAEEASALLSALRHALQSAPAPIPDEPPGAFAFRYGEWYGGLRYKALQAAEATS